MPRRSMQKNGTRTVATYTARDPEGQTVYWSLLSQLPNPPPEVDGEALAAADFADNGDFSISVDGRTHLQHPA